MMTATTTAATGAQGDGNPNAIATGRSDTLAYINLGLIALFAVIVVIAIVAGARLRARRKAADRANVRRIEKEATPLPPAPETTLRAHDVPPVPPPPIAPDPEPVERTVMDEPIAAAPAFDASPATEAADASAPADAAAPALPPLTTLKGLGPKAATRLADLGIADLPSLAALTDAQAATVDAELGALQGRLTRDRWVEQARLLVAGDIDGYQTRFGRLGG